MTREERLKYLAKTYVEVDEQEKSLQTLKGELRSELTRLMEYEYKGREHMLPVRTIEVPRSFFETTSMTRGEFVSSRFPGWEVEHCEENISTGVTTFILKRDPRYTTTTVEDEDVRLSKSIIEYAPQIDWDTLEQERPDLYDRLARFETIRHLDDEALETVLNEEPEELATLQRHMTIREPAVKITPKRISE